MRDEDDKAAPVTNEEESSYGATVKEGMFSVYLVPVGSKGNVSNCLRGPISCDEAELEAELEVFVRKSHALGGS